MTIRLSNAQARALSKLDRNEPRSAAEIGETVATCNALVVAGYATVRHEPGSAFAQSQYSKFIKVREL
jgi:hypothetical protein